MRRLPAQPTRCSMTGTDRGAKNSRQRGLIVQVRDLRLLRELAVMRVADREQVKIAAGFGSTTRANTRLLALTRAGLLRRFFLGSGGGRKALYALSAKGAQLAQVPYRGPRRRQNEMLIADFFVQHQLSVNAIYCGLKFGTVPVPQTTFATWLAFHEPLAVGLSLIPDGYVEFATPSGIDASFIEVDLGHEGLAVWKEKARHYVQFALSGDYERRFRQPRFRVLVLANSERRLHTIRAAVLGVTQKIFWFATLGAIRGEQFFAPVWLRPVGDTSQPFFKETP
ncbi:MAG: replication-relaxation family protein [Terracidiphilus sp.]